MDDVTATDEHDRSQQFRSRALTALVIQLLTGCTPEEAAAGVIDGFDDQGLDGIAVSADRRRVWIIQTKWADQGTASLKQGDALKMVNGITKLRDNEYDEFGDKFDRVRDPLDDALNTGGVRIVIVTCLLGKQALAPAVRQVFEKFVEQCNVLVPTAEITEIRFDDVYEVVKKGVADPPVDLSTSLEQWGQLAAPYQAYYGCVPVTEVATWYAAANERLFGKNIRRSLGLTEVNQRIRTTLREAPETFWYLNNGITVLCETLSKTFKGSTTSVGTFELTGASVVNGAQTVRSIYEVVREHPEAAASARVWVRLISLKDCPEDFAIRVTDATNTQNQVVARDFVSLDKVQAELRADFALTLGKIYVTKRGEPDPEQEAGCSVEEVAQALACAQPDAAFAARALKKDVLWERGEKGTYDVLFARSPGATRAWRLVTFMRAVSERLRKEENQRDGRAQRVASRADFLIGHVLLRHHDGGAKSEPSPEEWPDSLDLVGPLVDLLVLRIDELYGVHSQIPETLGDADRCVELAAAALDNLASGSAIPELPLQYQPAIRRSKRTRKPNVVTVLVDETAIPDGTALTFSGRSAKENASFAPWIAEDPRRGRATWVNNRGKPLLWEADGGRYSPTGLVMAMAKSAGLSFKAVQGPRYWRLPGGASLVERAYEMRDGDAD